MKIAFLLIGIFVIAGCSNEDNAKNLKITNSKVSIGAVNSDTANVEKQKLTYDITIKNPIDIRVVDDYEIIPAKIINDQVISWEQKGIEYNEKTIELTGNVIFSSKGLTKKQIAHFNPLIKGVQFISDNNEEYILLLKNSKGQ